MKIGCILVLYNPNVQLLNKVISSIETQVVALFISDNTPNPYFILPKTKCEAIYHKMNGNEGIAAAQNKGLEYFIEQGYDYIFFLDQDSIVEPKMIQNLLSTHVILTRKGIKVGAIGPRPINRQSNKEYRGSIKKGKEIFNGITEVTELINSASLISVEVLNKTGLMDANLFIDGVDHEWCWRGNHKYGYRFFINEKTTLSHKLGEGDRFFAIRKIAIPTPFRTYYQYRNYFWLLKRNYVPLYWKFSNGFKYLIKFFVYPILLKDTRYIKFMVKGIYHGIVTKKHKSNTV
jgi:rhamnosyltransferase